MAAIYPIEYFDARELFTAQEVASFKMFRKNAPRVKLFQFSCHAFSHWLAHVHIKHFANTCIYLSVYLYQEPVNNSNGMKMANVWDAGEHGISKWIYPAQLEQYVISKTRTVGRNAFRNTPCDKGWERVKTNSSTDHFHHAKPFGKPYRMKKREDVENRKIYMRIAYSDC